MVFVGVLAAEDFTALFSEYRSGEAVIRVVNQGPREGASMGSYAIYVYDGNDNFIAGLIEPRNGEVHKVWVREGKRKTLRLYVWSVSTGSGGYGTLDRYAFGGKVLKKLENLPTPKKKFLKGYMGHESYSVSDDKVFMQFPVYKQDDTNANPTGGTQCLEFSLRSGKWSESNNCK